MTFLIAFILFGLAFLIVLIKWLHDRRIYTNNGFLIAIVLFTLAGTGFTGYKTVTTWPTIQKVMTTKKATTKNTQPNKTVMSQSSTSSSKKASSSSYAGPGIDPDQMNKNLRESQNNVLKQLQHNYANFGGVTFSTKAKEYSLDPDNADMTKAFEYLIKNPTKGDTVGWTKLTKNFDATSVSINKVLNSKDYTITILQPGTNKPMYSTKNGKTTFDITAPATTNSSSSSASSSAK